MNTPELWDAWQIADYLRVDRKTVLNRIIHEPGFPRPLSAVRRNRLWPKDEVVRYLLKERAA